MDKNMLLYSAEVYEIEEIFGKELSAEQRKKIDLILDYMREYGIAYGRENPEPPSWRV